MWVTWWCEPVGWVGKKGCWRVGGLEHDVGVICGGDAVCEKVKKRIDYGY